MNPSEASLSPLTTGIEISVASSHDEAAWDRYVDQHPQGTFFHLIGWRGIFERTIGFPTIYFVAKSEGVMVGVLPLARVKSLLFGHALTSLPFCVEAGVLADNAATANALLAAAASLAHATKVDYLELRHSHRVSEGWPCKDATYVTFKRQLSATADENMKEIPRKQRAVVRKGIAAGLIAREEERIDTLFRIYATSVRNLGTPVFPKPYFAALKAVFPAQCRITSVYHAEIPVASVMSFLYKETVMPYYGGGLPVAREHKAFDFMYWEVMRTACEAGFKCFDYGRSKVGSGSFAFKKNWGFEPEPLHYEYQLVNAKQVPDRNPNNAKYEMAVNLWKKLPLELANTLGPWLSPYLA
jgi:FemAB-related protein (PEP-CTERM system-associated)